MTPETVHLDLSGLAPNAQVEELKRQFVLRRGKNAVVRARVGPLPVRQYISMLERGYRVALENESGDYFVIFRPDGSTPRLGLRGAHSVASDSHGRVYMTVIEVSLVCAPTVPVTPPKVTLVTPFRPVPVRVTTVPPRTEPLLGLARVMAGPV